MKKITVHALGTIHLQNKEFILEEDNLTVLTFLAKYLEKTPEQIERFFPQGNKPASFIFFVNGEIVCDRELMLQDGDKILISSMMGGG